MRLHEEYLKRHQLFSVPIIKHVPLGYLIIRNLGETCFSNSVNWTLLKIKWEDPIYHPGFYIIKFYQPYKSYSPESEFLRLEKDEIKVRWDEYEEYLMKWAAKHDSKTFITDPMEIVMTLWEMFIFAHEKHIVQQYNAFANMFFRTLDFTSNLTRRYNNYTKLLKLLDTTEPPFNAWQRSLNEVTKNYSPWLADLYV